MLSYSGSSTIEIWTAKVGSISGNIYLSGLVTISGANSTHISRLDSSYNTIFANMQSSDPHLNGFEIDKTESKIYSLLRPQSGITIIIFIISVSYLILIKL